MHDTQAKLVIREARAADAHGIVKTGRTHLMGALPIRMSQELGGWASQVEQGVDRIKGVVESNGGEVGFHEDARFNGRPDRLATNFMV